MERKREMKTQQTKLSVPSIVCDGCASAIRNALDRLLGVSRVDVDIAAKTVMVEHTEQVPPLEIIATLDRADFSASRI